MAVRFSENAVEWAVLCRAMGDGLIQPADHLDAQNQAHTLVKSSGRPV
jgi:hypothetical protein